MNKNKILYIAISSETGGVPKHLVGLLSHAKAYNYEITVAVPEDGDYFPIFEKLAADMLPLPLKPYSFRSLLQIRSYIRKQGICLVHSHGKGAGMYSRPLKLLCPGIKVIHTFHGIYLEQYNWAVKRFYCLIEHVLRYFTDRFICVSESEEQEAYRLGFAFKRRTSVIHNGVEPESFSCAPDRTQYLNSLNIPENAYIIGCVARLERTKGHRYLLAAFAKLLKKYPRCRLLLIGDGPTRQEIEAQISKLGIQTSVLLTGFRHDIPQLLSLCDLFVSASLKEGMPYTLVEALASGTPVVATDVIGNRDIIRDGVNGFLTPAKSISGMANALAEAIEHPELCQQYRLAGQKIAKRDFSLKRQIRQTFSLYSAVLHRRISTYRKPGN